MSDVEEYSPLEGEWKYRDYYLYCIACSLDDITNELTKIRKHLKNEE